MLSVGTQQFARDLVENIAVALRKAHASSQLGILTGTYGVGGDATKYGDELAEKIMRKLLEQGYRKKIFPYAFSISEEGGFYEVGEENRSLEGIFIILDPLDGSAHLRSWFTPAPFVATSLAVGAIKKLVSSNAFDSVEMAIVHAIFHEITYSASQGKGAFYNTTQRIVASSQRTLTEAIIAASIDGGGDKFDRRIAILQPVLRRALYYRRLGSTTLDLCRVASGDYDAYLALKSHARLHDVAAAQLIIKESGGFIDLNPAAAEKSGFFLRDMYENRDSSKIARLTFDIIATGTETLQSEIVSLLK